MTNLARLIYSLEMIRNQGKKGEDLFLGNQTLDIQLEWQKNAEAIEKGNYSLTYSRSKD